MKKFTLAIISPAFLAMGLLVSSAAISDDAQGDDLLIAQGNSDQMSCWGKLHVCVSREAIEEAINGAKKLPNPLTTDHGMDEFTCDILCTSSGGSSCGRDICNDRCNAGYAILSDFGLTCDEPPEFASLMDLLKKSPAVDSQPEEAEAEAVDST